MFKSYINRLLAMGLLLLGTQNVAWSNEQTASNQAALPFNTELGFKRITDPSTPDFLKQTSLPVFEIRSISEAKAEDILVYDLTEPKFANFEQKVLEVPQLDAQEKIVIQRQVQHCKKKGTEKECPIFFGIEKATGFLAGGDGSTLWTNAHVVNRFLKLRASLQQKSVPDILKDAGRVAIFIFDSQGKLVFDPLEDSATVTAFDQPSTMAAFRGDWYAEDTDYVGITLSRKMGVPLRIGAKAKAGDMIYRPGYPACTGCPRNPNITDPLENGDRGAGKNSSGEGFYWTAGTMQDVPTAISFLKVSSGLLGMFKLDQMLFFSADAQVGFSGGPMLNQQGEVVGIFAGSKPNMVGSDLLILSRGVRPPQW